MIAPVIDLSSDSNESNSYSENKNQSPTKLVEHSVRTPSEHSVRSPSEQSTASGSNGPSHSVEQNGPDTSKTLKSLNALLQECVAICDDDVMHKVVAKARRYFNLCKPEYRESDAFLKLLQENHSLVIDDSLRKYKYLKIVTDELKFHRKLKRKEPTKAPIEQKKVRDLSPQPGTSTSHSKVKDEAQLALEKELKREQRLEILWKTYNECEKKIKELEEAEVDWDDESDSAYMKEARYKEKLVKVFQKMQQLTENSLGVRKKPKIILGAVLNDEKLLGLNKRIETYINKSKDFPDFHDVKTVISGANEELGLGLSKNDVQRYAEDAFNCIGRQLQSHRVTQLQENLGSLLPDLEIDPAENDLELERKLRENREKYAHREAEVMAQFTQLAEKQNLVPEEVMSGDEKSEDEKSEDENSDDDNQSEKPADVQSELCDESGSDDDIQSISSKKEVHQIEESTDFDEDSQNTFSGENQETSRKPMEITIESSQDSNSKSSTNSNPGTSDSVSINNITKNAAESSSKNSNLDSKKPNLSIHKNDSEEIKSEKTNTFADIFNFHLKKTYPKNDITQNSASNETKSCNDNNIYDELKDLLESELEDTKVDDKLPSVSELVTEDMSQANNETKVTVSKVLPVKIANGSPRLAMSPKFSICDIPSTKKKFDTEKTPSKRQTARKTFPSSSKHVVPINLKPMQTPEISSSSQENKPDSDDDCIILD